MFCPECGHDVPDDARFCPNCGKALRGPTPADEEEEAPPSAEPEGPQPEEATAEPPEPSVPEPPAPAVPPTPEPAVPSEPPAPAVIDSAPEGAAEETAEETQEPPQPAPTATSQPAYQPLSVPPRPTPQPTPEPAPPPAPSPEPPPPAAPSAVPPGPQQPPGQAPGQIPPGQQPPPPAMPGEPGAAPPEEKKTNWGSICLIGCGILLLLSILGGLGLFLVGKWAKEKVDELPQTSINIIEPGEEGDEAGPEIREPGEGDGGPGSLMERLGESIEGLSEAISAASIEGFDPSSVDAAMLPTFYGFMVALADDNPQAMHQWMSPEFKERWSPETNWTVAPNIKHLGYRLEEKSTLDDGTVKFVIEETVRDTSENVDKVITWEIHFNKTDEKWFVTDFGSQ